MRFNCDRDVLHHILNSVRRIANGRVLPVFGGIRLEAAGDEIVAAATDGQMWMRVVSTDVDVVDEGSVVVPARLAADIVNAMPDGKVVVSSADDEMSLSSGRSDFSVRCLALADFPTMPVLDGAEVIVEAGQVKSAFERVVTAASTDDARPVLTGVLLEASDAGMRTVATDSFRLAVQTMSDLSLIEGRGSTLIPARALSEVLRVVTTITADDKLTVRFGDRDIEFDTGQAMVRCRLIEGAYPEWQRLIIKQPAAEFVASRADLLDALRRIRVIAGGAAVGLTFDSGDSCGFAVRDEHLGAGSEPIACVRYDGNPITIGFNPGYLAEGIEACSGDEIVFGVSDALKPVVMRGSDDADSYLYLVMPVRMP